MDDVTKDVLAGTRVNFVYIAPDGQEVLDRKFWALCQFVPRVGDYVLLENNTKLVVHSVVHKFMSAPRVDPDAPIQVVTVVLMEPGAQV